MRQQHHDLIVSRTVLALFVFALSVSPAAAGVVVGWDSNDGRVLLGELKCFACHEANPAAEALSEKEAPNLSKVGSRVTPQYLTAFLSAPHSVKPGTTMPDVMHGLPQDQRDEIVDALTHYLVSLGGPMDQRSSGASLGEIARGRELFHTVGCVACHPAFDPPSRHKIDASLSVREPDAELKTVAQPDRPSVPLPPLAMKTTVDELAKFLRNPLDTRPSGRMPSLSLQPGEGRSLAAYLLREQYTEEQKAPGSGVGFAFYDGRFEKAADLAQATPAFETQLPEIDLGKALAQVPTKDNKPPQSNFGVRFHGLLEVPADGEYRFWTKSDDGSIVRVNDQAVVENDGHHAPQEKDGKITLRRGRHMFEVLFMQGGGGFELSVMWQPPGANKLVPIESGVLLNEAAAMIPKGIAEFKIDAAKVKRGRELFATMRCAACHQTGEEFTNVNKAMPLLRLEPALKHSCISATVAAGLPLYGLNDEQRAALREVLGEVRQGKRLDAPQERIHFAMTTLNCYACHRRGEIGGPDAERSDYFVYENIVDLGDEGRLPPPLHDVGAKLTAKGFDDMLFSGRKYRTYMATRMPQFGKETIGHLPALFEKVDAGKAPSHNPEFSPRLVDDGRFLTGKSGLSCINCHAWGGHRLSGADGMDLIESPRRLRPGWFHAWLKEPQAMRPGTLMPTSWPNGKVFFPDVAGGDVDRQIDSIWAYLSVGNKGGFPAGLSPDDTLLRPDQHTIVFRTFLDKVSAHAILVGFRQRTHMAFDANRVRSVLAWTGPFVTTKPVWEGRAGQYATLPSHDVVWLPDGPPFAFLESRISPWPVDVPKAKPGSTRTPEGWRFRGYRLDKQRVPTFLYDVGDIRVEETPSTEFLRDSAALRRTFSLASQQAPNDLFFRAAAGKKIVETDGVYEVDNKLRFRLNGMHGMKPFVREIDGTHELILPLQFTKSGGKHVANFAIEMKW